MTKGSEIEYDIEYLISPEAYKGAGKEKTQQNIEGLAKILLRVKPKDKLIKRLDELKEKATRKQGIYAVGTILDLAISALIVLFCKEYALGAVVGGGLVFGELASESKTMHALKYLYRGIEDYLVSRQ